MKQKKFAIGVDIGGSHISSAVIDLDEKMMVQESYVNEKVNNKASSSEIMYTWIKSLKISMSKLNLEELTGIGFAMPGPFNYEKGIALFSPEVDKYENLYGLNIADYIKQYLQLPDNFRIRFINDASAFGVGEAWVGNGKDCHKAMVITLGTGFGSAFIEEGLPIVERNDVPKMGCLWHLPFKNGIGDDFFSTRWITGEFRKLTGKNVEGVKEILESPNEKEAVERIFHTYGLNLGIFISTWLKKFNAEVLIIGGNIANTFNLFGPQFKTVLDIYGIKTKISISNLMENASMFGSARMLDEQYWTKVNTSLQLM